MIRKIRNLYNRSKIDPEKFCPIPFLQLQLNPQGEVSACCFSNEYNIGNIKNNSITEIWNSEKIQQWRREFISGDIKICEHAMKTFQCHKFYAHLIPYAKLQETQKKMPQRLDLRLNGQCNLSCVMCSVWKDPNQLYDTSDFWKIGPTKIFPHLLEIDMLGGEPFIQKDTYRLIQEVSSVNPTCSWGFITNAQYKFTSYIRDHLDRIKIRHIHISLDSVHAKTYEKIRLKGKLEKSLQTLDDLIQYRLERATKGKSEFALFASMCVQQLNWQEVGDFLNYCNMKKISPILQNVVNHDHLSLHSLPIQEQEKIYEYLQSLLEKNMAYASQLEGILSPLQEKFGKNRYEESSQNEYSTSNFI